MFNDGNQAIACRRPSDRCGNSLWDQGLDEDADRFSTGLPTNSVEKSAMRMAACNVTAWPLGPPRNAARAASSADPPRDSSCIRHLGTLSRTFPQAFPRNLGISRPLGRAVAACLISSKLSFRVNELTSLSQACPQGCPEKVGISPAECEASACRHPARTARQCQLKAKETCIPRFGARPSLSAKGASSSVLTASVVAAVACIARPRRRFRAASRPGWASAPGPVPVRGTATGRPARSPGQG